MRHGRWDRVGNMTGASAFGQGMMRRRVQWALALGVVVLAGSFGDSFGVAQEKAVTAASAWVVLPEAGQTSTPAFVVVNNPGMYETWIVSALSDAAAKVELRAAGGAGTQPAKEIAVPAYGALEMKDGGAQLLLVDLTRPLKEGDTVSLTLTTDLAVDMKVSAVVKKR